MNDVAKRAFAELSSKREEIEAQLARIDRGDDGGMVDISDSPSGFRYGSERLESLRQSALSRLAQIEQDNLELEQITGCKRP